MSNFLSILSSALLSGRALWFGLETLGPLTQARATTGGENMICSENIRALRFLEYVRTLTIEGVLRNVLDVGSKRKLNQAIVSMSFNIEYR